MSGKKSYTMQEMRHIVNYLVERGAYSEIRGRAMWVNFANSPKTTRTWQSLKETFIKRILPDIHNPYYNLTHEQITSFRAGTDISKMSANRLEIGESSRSIIENQNNASTMDPPHQPEVTGEKSSVNGESNAQSTRSSTETVVLDTEENFANAEEVIQSLTEDEKKISAPNKSLKDMIIFQDPLTPMMQEIAADWDSDISNASGSENHPPSENVANAFSGTTSTADTFLPNNQEHHNLDNQTTQLSNPSIALSSSKTRSQANEESTVELKSVMKQNKKGASSQQPVKKKVRLSDAVSTNAGSGTSQSGKLDSGTVDTNTQNKPSDDQYINTRRKKANKSNPIGRMNSLEDFMAVLTNSILPNNPEALKVIKTILQDHTTKEENSHSTIINTTKVVESSEVIQADSQSQSSEKPNFLESTEKIMTRYNKKKIVKDNKNIDSQVQTSDNIVLSKENKKHTRKLQKNKNNEISEPYENVESCDVSDKKKPHETKNKQEAAEGELTEKSNVDSVPKGSSTTRKKNSVDNASDSVSDLPGDALSVPDGFDRDHTPSPIIENTEKNKADKDSTSKNFKNNFSLNEKPRIEALSELNSTEPETQLKPEQNNVDSINGKNDEIQNEKEKNYSDTTNIGDDVDDLIIVTSENCQPEIIEKELAKLQENEKTSEKPEKERIDEIFDKLITRKDNDVCSEEKVKEKEYNTKGLFKNKGIPKAVQDDQLIEKKTTQPSENTNFCTGNNSSDLPCSNPCLESVSLFEEIKENKLGTDLKTKNNLTKNKTKQVILLPSHSDSESDSSPVPVRGPGLARGRSKDAAKLLPRIFGYCDGANIKSPWAKSRRKSMKDQHRSVSTDSSSEASENEDQIPIPRPSRKVRYMHRPIEGRVQTLPDGALVAVWEGRVHRIVVQRGSRVCNFTCSQKEDGREKEIAESPRTSPRQFSTKQSTSAAAAVPVASTTVPATEVDSHVKREETVSAAVGCTESVESARGQACIVLTKDKITFTGDMEKIVPLLPQFQQVLNGLSAIKDEEPANSEQGARESQLNEEDIRARVEAREAEIFREIEERAAAASDATQAQHDEPKESQPEPELRAKSLRRKRPPNKNLPAPKPKQPRRPAHQDETEEELDHVSDSDHEIIIQEEGRKKKEEGDKAQPEEGKKRRRTRKQDNETSAGISDEEEPRYSLPEHMEHPTKHKATKHYSSQDVSIESTQGYLESDFSFVELKPKRHIRFSQQRDPARRRSVSLTRQRQTRNLNRYHPMFTRKRSSTRTQVLAIRVVSSEDENSEGKKKRLSLVSGRVPDSDDSHHLTPVQESLDSDNLMLAGLDVLPETDSKYTKESGNSSNVSLPLSPEISIVPDITARSPSAGCHQYQSINLELATSSNRGRRLSRNVSIVLDDCNISCPLMEQDLALASGETSSDSLGKRSNCSSIEEMEICVVNCEDSASVGANKENASDTRGNGVTVTDSLLSKVNDINIDETPLLESMQNGIVNMRLNSEPRSNPETGKNIEALRKGKYRCSTPNKKTKNRKSKHSLASSAIREESMRIEYSSRKRRNTCPPLHLTDINDTDPLNMNNTNEKLYFSEVINRPVLPVVSSNGNTTLNIPEVVVTPIDNNVTVRKWKVRIPRKPKPNILKVKIVKPKPKKTKNKTRATISEISCEKNYMEKSKARNNNDSRGQGSTSSASTLHASCSSTELIHNHSESCLAAQECLIDEHKYFMSETNASDSGVAMRRHIFTPSPDCFSSEAQDGTRSHDSTSSPATLQLSHLGSLLTEDSLPSPNNSWFLLSEEEEEFINSENDKSIKISPQQEDEMLLAKYGPHIAGLYPRACAVPDLSTITEDSSDTQGSKARPLLTPQGSVEGVQACSGSTQ